MCCIKLTLSIDNLQEDLLSYHSSHREQVGVVAALLQVHHNVEQGHLVPSALGVQSLKISCQDELVIFSTGQGWEHRWD